MEYEGTRVLPRGKSPGRMIAELFGCCLLVGLIVVLLGVSSVAVAIGTLAVFWVVASVLVLRMSRSRVEITTEEVRVRRVFGTDAIPREQIADVVLIRDLVVVGTGVGHLALVDATGRPLWRTSTSDWSEETIDALMASGQRSTVVDHSSPAEVRQRWASLVPASVARPGLSAVALLVFIVVVLGLVAFELYIYVT